MNQTILPLAFVIPLAIMGINYLPHSEPQHDAAWQCTYVLPMTPSCRTCEQPSFQATTPEAAAWLKRMAESPEVIPGRETAECHPAQRP
jgi:hypothetical protein